MMKITKQSRQPVENTIEVSLNGQSNPKSGITHARLMTDGSPSGGSCANLIDHPIQSAIEESLSGKNKPTKLLKILEGVAKRDKTIPNSDSLGMAKRRNVAGGRSYAGEEEADSGRTGCQEKAK
jgi:hypothetical protein